MKNRTLTVLVMVYRNVNILQQILIIQMLLCFDFSQMLRLRLDIPSIASSGSSLWLHCDYDLENDSLYSVKWYKNNLEFYRYMIEPDSPSATPKHKFFKQIGIYVDMSKSNSTHVLLKTTDLNTEGTYMAEVSTTTFKSVKRLKDLRIYVLPQHGIQIIGSKKEYKMGEDINLTCLAKRSKPLQILSWFVNDYRVSVNDPKINLSLPVVDLESDGLVSSRLGISLSLLPNDDHLSNGVLALRCSSILSQIYGVNFEELVIGEHGRYAGLQQTEGDYETLGEEYSPPQIHGHRNKYNIGDIVDLNCSTLALSPSPLLEWFINGRDALSSQLISYTTQSKEHYIEDNLTFSSTIYDNFADFEAHKKSSVLGLRFQIAKEHYQTSDGKLRLRCTATHAKIIGRDNAEEVLFSNGKQSSSLFASYATANGMAFGRFLCSAFLYLTVAWINSQ